MNKESFLIALSAELSGMPERERISTLEYYAEAIGDRVDAGQTEEQAVAELGAPSEIAARLCAEDGYAYTPQAVPSAPVASGQENPAPPTGGSESPSTSVGTPPYPPSAPQSVPRSDGLSRESIFWIVFGCTSPIWIGILAAVVGIFIALICTVIGLGMAALCCLMVAFPMFSQNAGGGIAFIGAALFCLGASVLLAVGTVALIRLAVRGVVALIRWGLTGSAKKPEDTTNEGSEPIHV